MKVVEKESLKNIPSKVDTSEILKLVKSDGEPRGYFSILKHLTNEDDEKISGWLNISVKTFRNHKKRNKAIKPLLMEHAIMLISLFKHGIDIFGNQFQFRQWLEKENFYFDRKAPIRFIDTISGIQFIDNRLTALEYGDNA